MVRLLMAMAILGGLASCAPPSPAAQADAAACTAQGDATYNAETLDEQARTGQNGLLYSATPNHVFDAEQLGAEHQRDSEITNCERNGNTAEPDGLSGPAPATPRIITTP